MNNRNGAQAVQVSELIFKIVQAGHLVDGRLDTILESHGLSVAKIGLLRHLAEAEGPITLGQLAERLACVKSNVTQLVDRLEADGLARRTPDPEDRRSIRAVITDKGRQMFEAGLQAQHEAERRLARSLTPDEQAQLAALLDHFIEGAGR
ncbi:MAG: MarR family transcriptional regulator [Anaerolineae bacterium]|nr:MarR family transcriptional regulator [Anaerolineae bacterium]